MEASVSGKRVARSVQEGCQDWLETAVSSFICHDFVVESTKLHALLRIVIFDFASLPAHRP